MYENLLRLPYFQGMSKNDLTTILDKVKLEFSRHENNETIVSQNEKCEKFIIVINGRIEAETTPEDLSYKLIEEHTAPFAIEPYSLFGTTTRYNSSYKAKEKCDTLTIDKRYFFTEFTKHNIFTINLLNLISRRAQFLNEQIWQETPHEIESSITRFIAIHSQTHIGAKTLIIKMERLATLLNETRINVSRALNNLWQKGLIELSRKEIHIPQFEKLLAETSNIKSKKYILSR